MGKIAIIIDDFFEDSEYTEPAKAFKEADHELVHVGLETGKTDFFYLPRATAPGYCRLSQGTEGDGLDIHYPGY